MSEDDAAFTLAGSLGSIWSLELLLILRNNPERQWFVDELDRELRASAQVVEEALHALARLGLVVPTGAKAWRYGPSSPDLDAIAGTLARLYATKRISVINAIHASAIDRMRTFASAFRIRG